MTLALNRTYMTYIGMKWNEKFKLIYVTCDQKKSHLDVLILEGATLVYDKTDPSLYIEDVHILIRYLQKNNCELANIAHW